MAEVSSSLSDCSSSFEVSSSSLVDWNSSFSDTASSLIAVSSWFEALSSRIVLSSSWRVDSSSWSSWLTREASAGDAIAADARLLGLIDETDQQQFFALLLHGPRRDADHDVAAVSLDPRPV